jgi:benzoyl-CoA reductase/2-hydroxyglutaryl-CoA dehydratase subunit BcrC/BadD/HgdB
MRQREELPRELVEHVCRRADEMLEEDVCRVALFCPLVPVEVIWAMGARPVLLRADRSPGRRADSLLQSFCCMRVRAQLEALLGGSGSGESPYSAVVAPAGCCDSIQNLASILATGPGGRGGPPVADLTLPVAFGSGATERYLAGEVEAWAERLAAAAGLKAPGAEELERVLDLGERLRRELRELDELVAMRKLSRSSFLAASAAVWTAPAEWLLTCLERAVERARAREPISMGLDLALISGPLDDLGVVTLMESRGARFVIDDCCTGSAVGSGTAEPGEGRSPYDRIAHRILTRRPCPVRYGSSYRRCRDLSERISQRGVEGAVLLRWKFCDPHAFDNVAMRRLLRRMDIPSLELELDPVAEASGQTETRCEAFLESLSGLEDLWS